jgi:hypothetical protein
MRCVAARERLRGTGERKAFQLSLIEIETDPNAIGVVWDVAWV